MGTSMDEHPIEALQEAAPIPDVLIENSDKAFFIRFGVVVLVLHAVVGLFALAAHLAGETEVDPGLQRQLVDERTRPVARVATTAQAAASMHEAGHPVAAEPVITAQQAVQQYCAACHASGLLGAPKTGDTAAWEQREVAAGGIDGLLESAIRGKGQMPPRGGAQGLSDEALRQAIELLR